MPAWAELGEAHCAVVQGLLVDDGAQGNVGDLAVGLSHLPDGAYGRVVELITRSCGGCDAGRIGEDDGRRAALFESMTRPVQEKLESILGNADFEALHSKVQVQRAVGILLSCYRGVARATDLRIYKNTFPFCGAALEPFVQLLDL